METAARWPVPIRWPLVGLAGVISLVTAPITAMWFLVLAPLALVVAAVGATLVRSELRKVEMLSTGASLGFGLVVGPLAYLALAAAT